MIPWAETVEMLGYIVGDGYHWWTEQVARGDDPQKLGTGDGDPKWEPNDPNAPAPWTWSDNPNGDGASPRMHEYALSYAFARRPARPTNTTPEGPGNRRTNGAAPTS